MVIIPAQASGRRSLKIGCVFRLCRRPWGRRHDWSIYLELRRVVQHPHRIMALDTQYFCVERKWRTCAEILLQKSTN